MSHATPPRRPSVATPSRTPMSLGTALLLGLALSSVAALVLVLTFPYPFGLSYGVTSPTMTATAIVVAYHDSTSPTPGIDPWATERAEMDARLTLAQMTEVSQRIWTPTPPPYPTALPKPTRMIPSCRYSPPEAVCQWAPFPTPTPTPLPKCETQIPGQVCWKPATPIATPATPLASPISVAGLPTTTVVPTMAPPPMLR